MNRRLRFMRMSRGAALQLASGTALGLLSGLGGCTLAPDYERPDVPIPETWPDGPAYVSSSSGSPDDATRARAAAIAAADVGWRDFFRDPLMQRLLQDTLEHNTDMRTAALNVGAAQAQYRIQRADLFPSVAATAIEQVEKYPSGVSTNSLGGGAGGGTSAQSGLTRFYNVGLGFTSYEIDLFGRIRSLNQEKLQQYFSYVETQRSVRISLIAEFGNLYLSYLAHMELARLTKDTLANQQASYDLTKLSYDGGVATALDLRQAEIAVDTARANLEQYNRQTAQDLNAFVLIGTRLPKDLPVGVPFDQYDFVTELAPGLPSEVLANRPDVRAAEHTLLAANADIGAARAAFFPSITLTGSYGTASRQLTGLFDHGSNSWTFSPQINLPIFTAGANVASLDLARIQKDVNIAAYEKVVETAFQEVANLLAARGTLDREIAADQALVEAAADAYKLSEMRFRSGVDNYLAVLDSQRTLYTAQQTLINVKLSRLQNLVTLYKALGGGVNERTPQPAIAVDEQHSAETTARAEAASPPQP